MSLFAEALRQHQTKNPTARFPVEKLSRGRTQAWNVPHTEILQNYGLERFLYRISRSPHATGSS